MSKTNDTPYDAVAKSEHELTEAELEQVSGGNEFQICPDGLMHGDFSTQKLIDKATPKLF